MQQQPLCSPALHRIPWPCSLQAHMPRAGGRAASTPPAWVAALSPEPGSCLQAWQAPSARRMCTHWRRVSPEGTAGARMTFCDPCAYILSWPAAATGAGGCLAAGLAQPILPVWVTLGDWEGAVIFHSACCCIRRSSAGEGGRRKGRVQRRALTWQGLNVPPLPGRLQGKPRGQAGWHPQNRGLPTATHACRLAPAAARRPRMHVCMHSRPAGCGRRPPQPLAHNGWAAAAAAGATAASLAQAMPGNCQCNAAGWVNGEGGRASRIK
jgi:hypothetical protein